MTLPKPATVPCARPTRVRHMVLAWICSLSVITYFDRVCISGAAPLISTELGLTPIQMGTVFGAFAISYALFEVPTGWLGDRIGARKVITRIVMWWSTFTALTGLAHHFWTMVVLRFLFGSGEAGMYPNSAKVFSRWFPKSERGFATGLMWMFGRMGGAVTPAIVVVMISRMGWRPTFWVFGAIGFVWVAFFWMWYRDTPREKAGVNAAEVQLIEDGRGGKTPDHRHLPWGRLLVSTNLWALCLQYFCVSYGWAFYITWLPTYLRSRGVSMLKSGVFGGMPLFFGGMGAVLGGLLTDFVVRKTGTLKSRRYIGFVAFVVGSSLMLSSVRVRNPITAVLIISFASFFGDLVLASSWSVCMDVGQEFAGTVSGCMNTWGNLAGFLFPIVTGFLIQYFGHWDLPIIVASAIFFLGALLWLRIDPTEVLVPSSPPVE